MNKSRMVGAIVGAAGGLALTFGGVAPAQAEYRPSNVLISSAQVGSTAEICSDWTNEDGTHGTNCPVNWDLVIGLDTVPGESYAKVGLGLTMSRARA